jgi:hypothetical protein
MQLTDELERMDEKLKLTESHLDNKVLTYDLCPPFVGIRLLIVL